MSLKSLAPIVLFAFVSLAVFGLFMPMSHGGHDASCPFAPGSAPGCVALLDHAEHWQSSFSGTFTSFYLVLLVAAVLGVFFSLPTERSSERMRYRQYAAKLRPPLMQELFSNGILNPKAP